MPEPAPVAPGGGPGVPAHVAPYLAAVAEHWPVESNQVADWHPDDQELYRTGTFSSFTDRFEAVRAQRQRRLADAVAEVAAAAGRPGSVADAELDALVERYTPTPVPPCSVCGGELSVQRVGGGRPTAFAHSCPGGVSYADWQEHYRQSRIEFIERGDAAVLALVAEVRALRAAQDPGR